MKEIPTTHIHDDPLPAILLPSHAELRLITASRGELLALISSLEALLGNTVSFSRPMPARRGWRVYGSVAVAPGAAKEATDAE
jgi:hypothetical protein